MFSSMTLAFRMPIATSACTATKVVAVSITRTSAIVAAQMKLVAERAFASLRPLSQPMASAKRSFLDQMMIRSCRLIRRTCKLPIRVSSCTRQTMRKCAYQAMSTAHQADA